MPSNVIVVLVKSRAAKLLELMATEFLPHSLKQIQPYDDDAVKLTIQTKTNQETAKILSLISESA